MPQRRQGITVPRHGLRQVEGRERAARGPAARASSAVTGPGAHAAMYELSGVGAARKGFLAAMACQSVRNDNTTAPASGRHSSK